jgi:hypothetical protein
MTLSISTRTQRQIFKKWDWWGGGEGMDWMDLAQDRDRR